MNKKYQFDHFQLDPQNNTLKDIHQQINVDEKALNLIKILIENRPNLVSKEELLEYLWPEQIISEWSLSRLVFRY